jgi:hypothetical protein
MCHASFTRRDGKCRVDAMSGFEARMAMSREKPVWLGHTTDHKSIEALLSQEQYTAEELAELTGINVLVIENAVFEHKLPAVVINHDIISISRHDVLEWLERTSPPAR